jgi:hypothetical protein
MENLKFAFTMRLYKVLLVMMFLGTIFDVLPQTITFWLANSLMKDFNISTYAFNDISINYQKKQIRTSW